MSSVAVSAGLIGSITAQWLAHVDGDTVQPLALRAPEVILGCPWDEKIDIWSVGCLVSTHPILSVLH